MWHAARSQWLPDRAAHRLFSPSDKTARRATYSPAAHPGRELKHLPLNGQASHDVDKHGFGKVSGGGNIRVSRFVRGLVERSRATRSVLFIIVLGQLRCSLNG